MVCHLANETCSISNSLSVLQHTQAVVFVYMEHVFRTYNVSPHTVFILLVVLCEPVSWLLEKESYCWQAEEFNLTFANIYTYFTLLFACDTENLQTHVD